MNFWILDKEKRPIRVSILEWAVWFEAGKQRCLDEDVCGIRVSTIFLGVDHSFGEGGPPILWETMTFGDDEMGQERCSGTWEQAEEMHKRIVKSVREALGVSEQERAKEQ